MPIAFRKDEWARIIKWTDKDKSDPEKVRRREYIRYLDDTSQAMTKSWPNSLENVNKRNEEVRQARLDAAEQANTKFYKRYVKQQQEEQERLMYSARDTIFKNKDAPKMLLGAVIETVVLKERDEQVKFKRTLDAQKAEERRRCDAEIASKAAEWRALQQLKAQRRLQANKEHQADILNQMREVEESRRREYIEELRMQQFDNVKAKEEIDALKYFDDEFKAAEKGRIWADMRLAREEDGARRRRRAAAAEQERRLLGVLRRTDERVQRTRVLTEHKLREEKRKVLEAISQQLESGDAARDAREQAARGRAAAEKHALEEARQQAGRDKLERIRSERAASHELHLRDQELRLRSLRATRQWDLMNRLKNQEIYEEFQENQRLEKERKVKEYREDILKLWREREDREAKEIADTRHFYGARALRDQRAADDKLLRHAAALLADAAARARPQRPLRKAIHRYCSQHRLYPMPELPASLQAHFPEYAPCDWSTADAEGREPAPPAPPGLAEHDGDGKRDGVQHLPKGGLPKPEKELKEESVQDYKRIGRANGMQRRLSQVDIHLPPIPVAPCKTADCTCDLKQ